jgi:uncharacterized protein
MSLEQLRQMFENVAGHALERGVSAVNFIWHGGEPLLIPVDYYQSIFEIEREIFDSGVRCFNVMQTNLTVLTERHLALFSNNPLFHGLGVSFDVYGKQRVDTRGQLRTESILNHMQKLIDHGVSFGAIAVLARDTVDRAQDIYRFYDTLHIESRFLPFYMSATADQISSHALSGWEITAALNAVFDAWMSSANATPVEPVDEYIGFAISHLSDSPRRSYDRAHDESVYIVDTDGMTWGVSNAYDPAYAHGNIFKDSMDSMLGSPARLRTLRDAAQRTQSYCVNCPYFGHCPGHFVADATPEQQRLLSESGCPVRHSLDYIVASFERAGVTQELQAAYQRRAVVNPALGVSL